MMEHKIMLLVRVNVFNSTHPTKRNFSIIICFMLLKFPTFCQPIVYEDYQIRKSLTSPINKGF